MTERNDLATASEAAPAAAAAETLLISRTFDAPRELVFKAWTEPERLAQWWGPKGAELTIGSYELREGGIFQYGLRMPDGMEMWGRWVFREIVAPERLAFVTSFTDRDGNVTVAPFPMEWPLEVLSTITFSEQDGRTTVSMTGIPINASDSERASFLAMHTSMQSGWGGTLDQLETYLADETR